MTKPVQSMSVLRSRSDACARSHKAIWSNCKNSQLPAGKAIQQQQSRAWRVITFRTNKNYSVRVAACWWPKLKKYAELKESVIARAIWCPPAVVCILDSLCVRATHRCFSRLKGLRIPRASARQMQISWAYYDGCANFESEATAQMGFRILVFLHSWPRFDCQIFYMQGAILIVLIG